MASALAQPPWSSAELRGAESRRFSGAPYGFALTRVVVNSERLALDQLPTRQETFVGSWVNEAGGLDVAPVTRNVIEGWE